MIKKGLEFGGRMAQASQRRVSHHRHPHFILSRRFPLLLLVLPLVVKVSFSATVGALVAPPPPGSKVSERVEDDGRSIEGPSTDREGFLIAPSGPRDRTHAIHLTAARLAGTVEELGVHIPRLADASARLERDTAIVQARATRLKGLDDWIKSTERRARQQFHEKVRALAKEFYTSLIDSTKAKRDKRDALKNTLKRQAERLDANTTKVRSAGERVRRLKHRQRQDLLKIQQHMSTNNLVELESGNLTFTFLSLDAIGNRERKLQALWTNSREPVSISGERSHLVPASRAEARHLGDIRIDADSANSFSVRTAVRGPRQLLGSVCESCAETAERGKEATKEKSREATAAANAAAAAAAESTRETVEVPREVATAAATTAAAAASSAVDTVVDAASSAASSAWNVLSSAASDLTGAAKEAYDYLAKLENAFTSSISGIKKFVKLVLDDLSAVPEKLLELASEAGLDLPPWAKNIVKSLKAVAGGGRRRANDGDSENGADGVDFDEVKKKDGETNRQGVRRLNLLVNGWEFIKVCLNDYGLCAEKIVEFADAAGMNVPTWAKNAVAVIAGHNVPGWTEIWELIQKCLKDVQECPRHFIDVFKLQDSPLVEWAAASFVDAVIWGVDKTKTSDDKKKEIKRELQGFLNFCLGDLKRCFKYASDKICDMVKMVSCFDGAFVNSDQGCSWASPAAELDGVQMVGPRVATDYFWWDPLSKQWYSMVCSNYHPKKGGSEDWRRDNCEWKPADEDYIDSDMWREFNLEESSDVPPWTFSRGQIPELGPPGSLFNAGNLQRRDELNILAMYRIGSHSCQKCRPGTFNRGELCFDVYSFCTANRSSFPTVYSHSLHRLPDVQPHM